MVTVEVRAGGNIDGLTSVDIYFPPEVKLPYIPLSRNVKLGSSRLPGDVPLVESEFPLPLIDALARLGDAAYGAISIPSERRVAVSFQHVARRSLHQSNFENVRLVATALRESGHFKIGSEEETDQA